jgi:hypothetical protein
VVTENRNKTMPVAEQKEKEKTRPINQNRRGQGICIPTWCESKIAGVLRRDCRRGRRCSSLLELCLELKTWWECGFVRGRDVGGGGVLDEKLAQVGKVCGGRPG